MNLRNVNYWVIGGQECQAFTLTRSLTTWLGEGQLSLVDFGRQVGRFCRGLKAMSGIRILDKITHVTSSILGNAVFLFFSF